MQTSKTSNQEYIVDRSQLDFQLRHSAFEVNPPASNLHREVQVADANPDQVADAVSST